MKVSISLRVRNRFSLPILFESSRAAVQCRCDTLKNVFQDRISRSAPHQHLAPWFMIGCDLHVFPLVSNTNHPRKFEILSFIKSAWTMQTVLAYYSCDLYQSAATFPSISDIDIGTRTQHSMFRRFYLEARRPKNYFEAGLYRDYLHRFQIRIDIKIVYLPVEINL